jgi:hypothetical protein
VPDGSDTGTLTVGVNNDDLFENRETVTATISNPSDLVINIVGASATANIEDNDNIAGSIDADLSVEDGDHGDEAGPDPIVYTVTLTEVNNTHSPITFNIAQVGGTATGGGVDYEDFASPTISVPHGARTGTLSVVVVGDDGLFENIETVIATISDPGAPTPLDSAININTPSVTANIIDEDNASDSISADFSVTTDGNEEGPVPISLLVTLGVANNTGTAITFDLAQIGGTATTIADYADIAGATISVADGATTGTLDLAVVDDADLEGDETVVFQISNESDPAVQITTATDTADILENDGSPGAIKADLSVTAHGNEEGPVSIEYMVTLSALNGTGSDITVDITRSSGTADVGADYAAFSSPTITIPDGASQGSLTVTVLEDDLFENDETITATISNPSHAAVAVRQATATANIVDSDNTSIDATLSLQTQGAEEGSVPMVFELALAKVNNTHQPITMTIEPSGGTATSGSDYSAFAGTQLSIPHGSQSAQLTVTVNDDNTLEANETIIVTLSNASDSAINFTNSPFTVSIPDNEATGEDDGDGLLNSDECPTGEGSCPDTDGDGLPNYQDSDDDGDGIPTRVECPDRLACVDTDGDSLPDYLEHNFLDTDDDGIPDREDRDDDNDGILTINELGSALSVGANELGHALSLQDSDGDGIPTYLDPDEDGPGSGDSDEDGFSDAEECPEGYLCPDSDGDSTPDYMQAATEALRSPFYTIWNSFFEQSNIIALLNKHHTSVGVTVTLFTRHGVPITEQSITLEGHQELDLILNNMPGYPENSYGLAKVEFDSVHALEGHSASYRAEPYNSQSESVDGMGLEFGILRPFSNPIKGESFAFFNTIQPSQVPFEADHVVPHWVQIGNTDETDTKRFTVKKYDIFGNEIQATVIAVPAQGRVDVDGGHVFPGRNAVGLIQIIPEDTEATYLAQVFHYGYNSEDVEQPNGFSFAMGERMRIGINKPQYLNVSNGAGARNWLTIANVGDASDTVNLLILDNNGSELVNHDFALGVNQQVHFLASDALGVNHSGMAIITSTGLGRVISNSRMYYYDEFGSVTSASLMEERYSLGSEVYALYNTYFEQLNWLSVFNLSDDTITFNVEAYNQDGSLKSSVPMEITSGTGVDAEIIHSLGVELEADRYGVLKIVPNQSGQYYAVIRRIKPGDDITTVDLGKPIPLR